MALPDWHGSVAVERRPLVLASASPRRHALLRAAGVDFRLCPADVDETVAEGLHPEAAARELALRKAQAVAARLDGPAWVLGADTVVGLEREAGCWVLLGKPAHGEEARAMLRALSDTRHLVVTGVAIVGAPEGRCLVDAEATWVRMRVIEPAEVEAYVASGEWQGKAGGYAIQENADRFVTGLEGGGFDNVVGLPVARTLALLAAAEGAPLPPNLRPDGGRE
jgi:septum formation protein